MTFDIKPITAASKERITLRNYRRLTGGLAAAAVAAAVAACGSSSPSSSSASLAGSSSSSSGGGSSSHITIAGVLQNTADPFWTSVACGAVAEGKTLGVTVKNYASTGLDTSQLSANFTAAQQSQPSGMFADLLTANQFITQWKQLMTTGHPIVAGNATNPAVQYKVVFTSPTSASSPFLSTVLNLIPSESGDMAVLAGVPGLVPVTDRLDPLVSAIKNARSGLSVLPSEYSGFDTNKATQYVTSTLLSHPNLKVIVAADGPDAIGVVSALQAAHKAGQIKVIALDAIPPEVTALKSGVISALIAQQPEKIGAAQVKTLVDYIKTKKSGAVPASNSFTGIPQVLLTKANVNAPSSQQYFYKTSC